MIDQFRLTKPSNKNLNLHLVIKLFVLLGVLIFSFEICSQEDIDLYNQANLAFNRKQYLLADSLYTASINLIPSSEAYFNRAATKLVLTDTCNACKDLFILKNGYSNKDAFNLYKEFCIKKIDTIYYDNKFLPIYNNKKYKYYEIIPYLKCGTLVSGEIHKINHKESQILFPSSLNFETSDIFALYIIENKLKYYTFIYTSTFEYDNRLKFEEFEEIFANYFSNNYDFSKIEYKDKWIGMDLYINNEGKIVNGKILSDPLENFEDNLKNKIRSEMILILRRMPKLTPEKLMNDNVGCIYNIILGIGK